MSMPAAKTKPLLSESALARLLHRQGIDTAPFDLNQRRLFILPTRHGWVFAALLVGLLIGSANYSISLGYLFTFLLGGLGMVAMFHTQRNLSGLRLSPGSPEPVFAGDPALFPLHLENPAGLARHALTLAGRDGEVLCDIPGYARISASIPAQPSHRGMHPIGRITLSSTWPLGLFRCWTVFEFDWQVLVYPRPAASHWPLPIPRGTGMSSPVEAAGEDSFSGLRNYHPGDSPRRVAWKAVARGLALQTKHFSGQPAGSLWLDWNAAPEHDAEARLSRLARWALEAEKGRVEWAMRLPARSIRAGRGEAHLRLCLEALARHEA
jgi:uncharacterized protein (DUF58 family)